MLSANTPWIIIVAGLLTLALLRFAIWKYSERHEQVLEKWGKLRKKIIVSDAGSPVNLPPPQEDSDIPKPFWMLLDYRLIVTIIVSLVVLCSALYLILSNKYDADSEKWAFGTVGMILGHWLKS